MVAVAIGGAAVVGAGSSIIAGNKASKAQKNAANAQIAEQRRQYDQTRADYAPWRAAGQSALSRLENEMKAGATTAFTKTPGYDFRLSEGVKAAERSAAARGRLGSGATMKAVQRYGEGLASDEYGNWWNRNAGLAGVGQAATDSTTQAGMNAANNITGALGSAGNARASAYANTGSAINSGINNVLAAYLAHQGGMFSK
ncbi:hypothetical protein [Sphingopyxis sp. JAI128]|uniref:hypothetical protein n=1 Tax=Sphingopyxis sp. JAI128 TaxID=2723066 RepID=UPI0016209FAA|nr:hypothetical protein [Sphingopyxis sp. JAI128]MBB6424938.1 hypothetical protein [Sphingopyxis sp. JAI128]